MMPLLVVLESGPRFNAFGARFPYYCESPRKVRSGTLAKTVRRLKERRCSGGILFYQSRLFLADRFSPQDTPLLRVYANMLYLGPGFRCSPGAIVVRVDLPPRARRITGGSAVVSETSQ